MSSAQLQEDFQQLHDRLNQVRSSTNPHIHTQPGASTPHRETAETSPDTTAMIYLQACRLTHTHGNAATHRYLVYLSRQMDHIMPEVLLKQHFEMVTVVAYLLMFLSSVLPLGLGACQRGKRYRRPASLQLPWVWGELLHWQLFKLGSQLQHLFFLYIVRHMGKVRRQTTWLTPVKVL